MQTKSRNQIVLESIADTFCPTLASASLSASSSASVEYGEFANFTPSRNIPNCGLLMEEYLNLALPADKLPIFKAALTLLSTSIGTSILTGNLHRKPFTDLNQQERENVLNALKNSWFADLQILFSALFSISCLHAFGVIASSDVAWPALGYSLDPILEEHKKSKNLWRPTLLDLTNDAVNYIECDIVVVGSGCGGGLMAAELSQAGYSVVLCEKAAYSQNQDYIFTEREAMMNLYEKGAGFQAEDGAIRVLAGSAWGGGSAVNWCASFKPPLGVREEWARTNGLNHVLSAQFEEGIETVWKKLGVTDSGVVHNVPNQILLDGCAKIGLKADPINQNTSGQDHQCGACTMGCPSGTKNSSHLTWIKTAAEHGCRFITGIHIDKIIHASGSARGVEGFKNGKKVIIKAKRAVVVSGGSISTPALLLRSRIPRLNPHVGRHLRLHPVGVVSGVFPDRIIAPHAGSIMTAESTYVDEKGYGYKIEVPTSLPALFAVAQKFSTGVELKSRMLKWKHTSQLLILTRDYDSEGKIYIDAAGAPRLEWSLGPHDEKNLLHGMEACIRILVVEGAKEVYTGQANVPSFFPDPAAKSAEEVFESREFVEFITKMRMEGMKARRAQLFSAHQMGSCRMHSDPKQGAVSPTGKLYGLDRVYISDSSVFPTASGVNPMMTTYSMAYSIAQSMKRDLQKQSSKL